MRTARPATRVLLVALALLGAACTFGEPQGLDVTASATAAVDAPTGYHRMPDGTLMADVASDDHTEHTEHTEHTGSDAAATRFARLGGSDVELPYHLVDGERFLGPAPAGGHQGHGGHDHAVPSPEDFAAGVVPARILVPAVGIDAPTPAMALSPALEVPPVPGDVAWLEATRRPGEVGPAVLGALPVLDGAPTVLAGLDAVAPGDDVVVVATDGTRLRFVVSTVGTSTDRSSVFAMGEGRAELRLVAWGTAGAPDLVVTAHLA